MQKKIKNIGVWTLKILVFVIAWAYVIYKFKTMEGEVFLIFSDKKFSYGIFIAVCLLMLANWGLEALKWQKLISCHQSIPYSKSVAGVLVGLPLALVTPNRIGEIGGRAIILEKNRKEAVFATLLGSLMQLATTLIMGVFGIILFLLFLPHNQSIERLAVFLLSGLFVILFFCVICKRKRAIRVGILKIFGRVFYKKILYLARIYSLKDILSALGISILRYFVFATQFILLIYMLLPELTIMQIFVGVTLMYLLTTLIPTSVLGEIGIRGSVAIFVFQLFTTNVSPIFQISILIWLINIVLPTLSGSLILLNVKGK
ncbi:MAG: flippase-like domain-containing protein [Bacteroidales bacterium]|nr:flippase-like domain-containing protein [Bacteroidales bacterium]